MTQDATTMPCAATTRVRAGPGDVAGVGREANITAWRVMKFYESLKETPDAEGLDAGQATTQRELKGTSAVGSLRLVALLRAEGKRNKR